MLQTKVKANSITHLTDARYFAAWEVEWLGFMLSPGSENSVSPQIVSALREWVDGVKICGEFSLGEAEELTSVIETLSLDSVQLGMLTPLETLQALHGKAELIQEIVVESYAEVEDIEELLAERVSIVDHFLLNFSKGGLTLKELQDGIPFDQEQLRKWASNYSILVDLGDVAQPTQVAEELGLAGFAVQGGAEEKVGYKSFDELDTFFEDLEVLV